MDNPSTSMSTPPSQPPAPHQTPPPHSQSPQPPSATTTTTTSTSTTKPTFQVLLFASAASLADDTDLLTLPAPMTLHRLFDELERRFPGMRRKVLSSAAVTVNLEYLDVDVDGEGRLLVGGDDGGEGGDGGKGGGGDAQVVFKEGDEVAIVPPVSSG